MPMRRRERGREGGVACGSYQNSDGVGLETMKEGIQTAGGIGQKMARILMAPSGLKNNFIPLFHVFVPSFIPFFI